MLHPLLQRQHHLLVLAIERCALPLPTKKVLLEVLSASAETALQQQTRGSTTITLWCQVEVERWAACLDLESPALLARFKKSLPKAFSYLNARTRWPTAAS